MTARRARARALHQGRSVRGILIGKVHNVDGLIATIEVNGGMLTIGTGGLVLAPGDIVSAFADNNRVRYLLGRIGASLDDLVPPRAVEGPDAPPQSRRGHAVPTFTGTYRGGWQYGDDLEQGKVGGFTRSTGCAFYGDQVAALHALPGTVGAVLTLRRAASVGVAGTTPKLWLLTERRRTPGPPTRTLTAFAPPLEHGEQVTWRLPAAWAEELAAGTAGGIAVHVDADTPAIQLDGQRAFAASMALSITYER